ncbi:hypothetical protein HN51_011522 [Arachis hypogaea]
MDSSMCSSAPDPEMWIIQGTLAWRTSPVRTGGGPPRLLSSREFIHPLSVYGQLSLEHRFRFGLNGKRKTEHLTMAMCMELAVKNLQEKHNFCPFETCHARDATSEVFEEESRGAGEEEVQNTFGSIFKVLVTIEDVNEVNFIEAEKFPLLHSWFNNFKNVTMIKENFLDMEKMLATIKSIIGKRWNLSDRSHQYMIFASWVGRGVAADAEGGAGEEALGWAVGGGDVVFVTVDPEELAADLKSRMRGTRIRGICYLRHQ